MTEEEREIEETEVDEDAEESEESESESLDEDEVETAEDEDSEIAAEESEEPAEDSEKPAAKAVAKAPEPFRVKFDNQEVVLPGATVKDGKLEMPVEVFQRHIHPHLVADRRALFRDAFERGKAEGAKSGIEGHETVVKAQQVLTGLSELMKQGPVKVLEWLQDLDRNWANLQLRAENEWLRQQGSRAAETTSRVDAQRQWQEIEPQIDSGLREYLTAVLGEEEFKESGLSANALFERAKADLATYVFVAREDMPEDGLRKGELGVYIEKLRDLARWAFQIKGKPMKPKVKKVAKKNEAALRGGKKLPAAVSSGTTSASGGAGKQKFKNADEFNKYWNDRYEKRSRAR